MKIVTKKQPRLRLPDFRVLWVLHAFYGFVLRGVYFGYAREPGYLKNLLDVLAEARKRNFAGNLFELLGGGKEDPQAGAADVFKLPAFHQYLGATFGKERVEYLFELRGCCHIEPAFERDNRHVVYCFLGNFHMRQNLCIYKTAT